jgi:hypothetical protein
MYTASFRQLLWTRFELETWSQVWHLQFAAFLDHHAQIAPFVGLGHRFLELPGFERWFLRWVANFTRDWKKVLPDTHKFVQAEAARAERLGWGEKEKFIDFWQEELGVEAARGVLDKALLYFRDALMGVGFSFLHVLDPILGPLWAKTVLAYLDGAEGPPLPNPLPPPYDPTVEWTGLDPLYPYPEMTSAAYMMQIWASLVCDAAATKGMLDAYGLRHLSVRAELERVAGGEVASMLTAQNLPLDEPLKNYWSQLAAKFPYLVECLKESFNHATMVTTRVELMFSILNNQQFPNATVVSTSNNVAFQGNVRMPMTERLKRDLREEYDQRIRARADRVEENERNEEHEAMIRAPGRRPRSLPYKHQFADGLLSIGLSLPTGEAARAAGGRIHQRKHADERKVVLPQAMAAMDAAEKKGRSRLGAKKVDGLVKNYKESKENHLPTFVKPVVSEHRARALLFLAPKARSYLLTSDKTIFGDHFPHITFSIQGLKDVHHKPTEKDPDNYISLMDVLQFYFENGGEDPPGTPVPQIR